MQGHLSTRGGRVAGPERDGRSALDVGGVADGDGERVGGVVGRRGSTGRPSRTPTMCLTWSLAAEPVPQTASFTACGV